MKKIKDWKSVRISFIIPCYNCSKTIGESIKSIINIGLSDYEICLVDDFSTDSTLEVIETYRIKFPDIIKVSKHDKNLGGAATRNDCVRLSRYEWIFCLDSDNILHKKSFIKIIQSIRPQDNLIFFREIKFFFSFLFLNVTYKKWIFNQGVMVFGDLRKTSQHPVADGNLLFSRRLFDNVGGYDTDLGAYDSYAFGYKALYNGYSIKMVEDTWYYHRVSLNSYWMRDSSKDRSLKTLLLRYPEKFSKEDIKLIESCSDVKGILLNSENTFTSTRHSVFSRFLSMIKNLN